MRNENSAPTEQPSDCLWLAPTEDPQGIKNLAVDELIRLRDTWELNMKRLYASLPHETRAEVTQLYLKYFVDANFDATRALVRLERNVIVGRTKG